MIVINNLLAVAYTPNLTAVTSKVGDHRKNIFLMLPFAISLQKILFLFGQCRNTIKYKLNLSIITSISVIIRIQITFSTGESQTELMCFYSVKDCVPRPIYLAVNPPCPNAKRRND